MRANVYIKTVERDETKRTLYILQLSHQLATWYDSRPHLIVVSKVLLSWRYLLMSGVQLSYDNCVWSFLRNTALAVSLIV